MGDGATFALSLQHLFTKSEIDSEKRYRVPVRRFACGIVCRVGWTIPDVELNGCRGSYDQEHGTEFLSPVESRMSRRI